MMCVPGEPCPENGRSPGSVSTHHSSPRSDYATYTNTYSNSNHAVPTSNASPPEGFASHSLQTSDVEFIAKRMRVSALSSSAP